MRPNPETPIEERDENILISPITQSSHLANGYNLENKLLTPENNANNEGQFSPNLQNMHLNENTYVDMCGQGKMYMHGQNYENYTGNDGKSSGALLNDEKSVGFKKDKYDGKGVLKDLDGNIIEVSNKGEGDDPLSGKKKYRRVKMEEEEEE